MKTRVIQDEPEPTDADVPQPEDPDPPVRLDAPAPPDRPDDQTGDLP